MGDTSSDDEIREAVNNPYLYDPKWESYMADHCDVKVTLSMKICK